MMPFSADVLRKGAAGHWRHGGGAAARRQPRLLLHGHGRHGPGTVVVQRVRLFGRRITYCSTPSR